MGQHIDLTASDGHRLSAYQAGPDDAGRGLVVVQEIFGVNRHMREVCDRFAAAGYYVVCPALFDRVRPGIELGYAGADVEQGRALRGEIPDNAVMQDVEAAAGALGARVRGIVGYCWGGTVAWWGATRSRSFGAAVSWYGGGIAAARTEPAHCPVQLHFGEQDTGIPMPDVEAIRAAQPEVEIFTYAGAGHGFGCEDRDSFNPAAAKLAYDRTMAFLERKL